MNELYDCPLCRQKKAWASSTYPNLVVHNCRGFLEDVGVLEFVDGTPLQKKIIYKPYSKPTTDSKYSIKEVASEELLKQYFLELELDNVNEFKVSIINNHPTFWDKLWEYECFRVLDSQSKLKYLLFFNNYSTIRPHAHCCLGRLGEKPSKEEAFEIVRSTKDTKLQIKDINNAVHFMTKKIIES